MTTAPKFDPKNAFFLIDSEDLDSVKSAFYGFTIQNGAITSAPEGPLTGDGAYVSVCRNGDTVTVSQDFVGCYGLYLLEQDSRFLLSNSFAMLFEYAKRRFSLTLNREYADYFLTADLCSASFSETAVNEIRLLDRAAVVNISIPDKKLTLSYLDYQENTLSPDSPEGMAVLDQWFHKWGSLIRNLKSETNNIQTDLSGGFDSRLVFSLLLGSNVDLNDVFIFSIEDTLHTHTEDFAIATAMGDRFGFRLNQSDLLTPGLPLATAEEILNISLYTKQSFHKQIYQQARYYTPARYNFAGNGGECVRAYWTMTEEEFIRKATGRTKGFPKEIIPGMETSIRNILSRSFRQVEEKFRALGRPLTEEELTLNLYRETRCRNHFGKAIVERYLANSITCAPLLDPLLHRLKRGSESCPDANLLSAIIYSRFGRDLLEFPFDGGRAIDGQTVAQARALNDKYPFRSDLSTDPIPTPREVIPEKLESMPVETLQKLVLGTLSSRSVQESLTELYGKQITSTITRDIRTRKFHPLQSAFAAISVAWAEKGTRISRYLAMETLGESFFRAELPEEEPEPETLRFHKGLEDLITARIDLRQTGGSIELLEISDRTAKATAPEWFCKDGSGYVVESQAGFLTLRFRSTGEENVDIVLRGRAATDSEGKRIPLFVDYTGVSLNGEEMLAEPRPICHDVPMKLSAQGGTVQELRLSWEPHSERRSRRLERIRPETPKTEAQKPETKKFKFWR